MTYASIKDLLDEIGLPYTYDHWDTESVPELPWIVFTYPGRDDFVADDGIYQKIISLQIDLYTDQKDLQAEPRKKPISHRKRCMKSHTKRS